jgi:predicted RNase H-like HicB family nuclease
METRIGACVWRLDSRRRVNFKIEFERDEDRRWIAEISELPGVMACGATQGEAEAAVEALALRAIADTTIVQV